MVINKVVAVTAAAAAVVAVVAMVAAPASGQAVAASCTASLITSFTPCFNFITSSSNGTGAGTPTAECCQSVAAMINTSASCACLVLTGNVPLGIPINRTLAVTLPKACNSMSVPLQCKDTSAQIPAAGVPVAVSPAMPPLPPSPPESTAEAGSPTTSPVVPTATATPPATSQTQTRPQVVPSSAWRAANAGFPAFLLLLAAMLF
uniref:Bifunctional inhibitor/plant lipid transfer protein/seed storage helical domain-containing protein n=1 Tax=Oryza punctata TaxID=4537 RepID=A0A0E0LHQ3_ORYPU